MELQELANKFVELCNQDNEDIMDLIDRAEANYADSRLSSPFVIDGSLLASVKDCIIGMPGHLCVLDTVCRMDIDHSQISEIICNGREEIYTVKFSDGREEINLRY